MDVSIFRGEIESFDTQNVVCWVEVIEGTSVKTEIERKFFPINIWERFQFNWNNETNEIQPLTSEEEHQEILDDLDRLQKEWEELGGEKAFDNLNIE